MLTKKCFVTAIRVLLKGIPAEEQIQTMEKMKVWLDDLIDKQKQKRTYCPNCGKYSLTTKFIESTQKEIRHETIYSDCGYGDDDTHGDVEYLVTYHTCPICNHQKESMKMCMRIISEYDRYGNKIR